MWPHHDLPHATHPTTNAQCNGQVFSDCRYSPCGEFGSYVQQQTAAPAPAPAPAPMQTQQPAPQPEQQQQQQAAPAPAPQPEQQQQQAAPAPAPAPQLEEQQQQQAAPAPAPAPEPDTTATESPVEVASSGWTFSLPFFGRRLMGALRLWLWVRCMHACVGVLAKCSGRPHEGCLRTVHSQHTH
jgi:hypothetical protein